MQTQHLQAGTPEWHAHRAQHFNASDAPAMLGCSPYKTRAQLLRELATGIGAEHDAATERRFADGHRFEALARPLAEEIIGDDLAPVVGVLEGTKLSASFDGLTLMGDTAFEHKTLNDDLRGCMRDQGNGYDLPKHYCVQMEQQLMVSGAERVLFMASKWDGETLVEERHCWYASDPKLRAEIIAGWKQFDADLAAYTPPDAAAPKLVAEPVEALPAPVVQVSGQLTLQDNFKVFEERLRHFLEHRLIRQPKTDQDFADLDLQIKSMKQAREALKAAEAQMLAQVQPVDQAKKTKDMLDKLLQQNLSMSETLLKDEKERRRGEIVAGGVKALADHLAALNQRLGKPYMPAIPADFGGCIKGLKSLASMEDKVATELARAKIAANESADRIQSNLQTLAGVADRAFLFADTRTLVLKAPEDLQALVTARIAEHKAAEEKRLEAERARIRAEEEAKVRREQEERAAQEAEDARQKNAMALSEIQGIQQQVMIASLGRAGVRKGGTIECIRETLAETEAWKIDAEGFGALAGAAQLAKDKAVADIRDLLADAEARAEQQRQQQDAAAPVHSAGYLPLGATPVAAPSVIPMPTRAPAAVPAGPPTMTLSQVKAHIAPFQIDAAGLEALGFPPAGREGAAKLYHQGDLDRILAAGIAHLTKARDQLVKAA